MSREKFEAGALRWFGRPLDVLRPAERRILEQAHARQPIAADSNADFDAQLSFGDRLSDRIAIVGGSWGFILGFLGFLVIWALVNTVLLTQNPFDPYPFIFLNLILSMLAAIQAPIIMMSQNRAAARDRLDASHDYQVNLKAEIEILALHEKVDALRGTEIAALGAMLAAIDERLDRMERSRS
ncbi:DUF1003 domain-containing protein [Aurantimonas endophytica]|uniref:Putative membrane protein n=1 Tax=Aurantimonas endophytica TaxID=1522175 RepID=A0A7W6HAW7_9HYPH|nr:DUF1003 domain-containing protein [Aurantimonas endophytica]MBB4001840.1 putative membrane protein [Aurantimonas endophytica]MCO6402523.1 DUF1003 domain-containing protein [Aurantimonas endophytica]